MLLIFSNEMIDSIKNSFCSSLLLKQRKCFIPFFRPVKLEPPQVNSPPAVARLGCLWEVDGAACGCPIHLPHPSLRTAGGSEKAESDLRRYPISSHFTGRKKPAQRKQMLDVLHTLLERVSTPSEQYIRLGLRA